MAEEKKPEEQEEQTKDNAKSNKKADAEAEGSAELKDRLLRLAAEFDNYKKRVAKDMDASKRVGKAELMRKLVPVLDEFELALNAKGLDEATAKGIELVYSNLIDVLKGEGLVVVDTKGKFDPFKHEIMLTRECAEEDGNIIEVIRKGYSLGDILIRPASVIISQKYKEKGEPK